MKLISLLPFIPCAFCFAMVTLLYWTMNAENFDGTIGGMIICGICGVVLTIIAIFHLFDEMNDGKTT